MQEKVATAERMVLTKAVMFLIVAKSYSDAPAGQCEYCGGSGEQPETIDEERYAVLVPCWACRRYCRECNRWVAKSGGHACKEGPCS